MTESTASSRSTRQKRDLPKLFQGLRKPVLTEEEVKKEAKEKILRLLEERRSHYLAVAYRIMGDRSSAEDVVQNAYLHVFTTTVDMRTVQSPAAWMHRIVVNRALDELRHGKVEAKALREHGLPPEQWTDQDVVDATAGYLLIREVMADVLTDRQHDIYILRHVRKFNSPEIAKAIGIKAPLVRKELQKAQAILTTDEVRKRLRDRLHGDA